jgi:pimeloyl-ACP methyl ester carboxylesterase
MSFNESRVQDQRLWVIDSDMSSVNLEIQVIAPNRGITHDQIEDIVLIHGMGSASTAWQLLIPPLRQHFRIITVDLPGHGKTPYRDGMAMDPVSLADMVNQSVSKVSNSFHVVGNSLGGWIALELAAHFGERVRTLTALAPAGMWINPFQRRYPATAFLRMFAKSTRIFTPLFLHFEWARSLGFSTVSPRWREFSYRLAMDAVRAMTDSTGYYPAFNGMLMKRFESEIPDSIPVTIIFGDSDNTLPARSCQERSLAPDHARWVTLAETGHAPMWDSVNEVMAELLAITGKKNGYK